jgi:CheY-like chemotaxis protein
LAFARDEAVDSAPVDLNDIATGIEEMLHRTLGDQISLELSLEAGLRPVHANPGQIEQLIVNLAVNARDAMPAGGKLSIETTNISVDAGHAKERPELAPGEYVRLRVSDTGIGMDPQARDHAFEPFFTTKQKGSGTGLGLATVYAVVTRAGGTIHIYSEPDLGTSISAMFPATVAPTSPQPTSPTPSTSRAGGNETILLVEDNDDLRSLAQRILSRVGYRVLTAHDGANALVIAGEHPGEVDLLLTDVAMPNMLGSELAIRLRESEPAIRVLFMSGYAPPLLLGGGTLPLGAPVIDKPFSADVLAARVRQALDGPAGVADGSTVAASAGSDSR